MISTYIGSGDVAALLAGVNTETHQKLLRRFVSNEKPYYNAKASPIDALRTGAILEDRYLLTLPDNFFAQYIVVSKEMDVFKSSLDFAKIENGEVVDFDELKSVYLSDYLDMVNLNDNALFNHIKKKYKNYYNQIQQQLYVTELEAANLVFLSVTSYDDEENYRRNILPNEFFKFRIYRDEQVINKIKERGQIFQQIKDYYDKD